MGYYRVTGSILIEGTLEQADYDVDIEDEDIENPDDPIQILDYMLRTGVIQILHEDTEYYGDENE